jgi:zinc transporter, ZIP family
MKGQTEQGRTNMDLLVMGLCVMSFVFIGTWTGGGVLWFSRNRLVLRKDMINLLCGGILLGLLVLEIIPEALTSFEEKGLLLGLLAGVTVMYLLDHLFHPINKTPFFLLCLAFVLHNVPTGIGLGIYLNQDETTIFSSPFLVAMFFHHIPEGLALMASAIYANVSFLLFTLVAFLLAMSFGVSATFGNTFFEFQNVRASTLLMGTSIGTLCFITLHEFLGKSLTKDKRPFRWLYILIGILITYTLGLLH